jgi:dehydrogenase/reductase SDR family protein 7B
LGSNDLSGTSVWITGASSGIGLDLARLAAESGASLVLLSSREGPLAEAARECAGLGAAAARHLAVDLGDPDAAAAATRTLLAEAGPPRILLLNAGISQRSLAGDTDLAVTERILRVNFLGAVAVARTVLAPAIEAGGLRIGVTSSLTGIHGFPLRSSYAASKHALHGYFESLWIEYRDRGVDVTMAVPGRIRTAISLRSLKGDGAEHGVMDPGQAKGMDSRRCAEKYLRAVLRGRPEVVIGGPETVTIFLKRHLPGAFRALIGKAGRV